MLFTLAILAAIGGAAFIVREARAAARVDQAELGRMSAQWLADHRASHL